MKEVKKELAYRIYSGLEELELNDAQLLEMAIGQLKFAYAPYSEFHVGAALRLIDGKTFVGSNQENASYPLCMCGERVALYNAAANAPHIAVECLAITAKNQKKSITAPISPCGACRQVILEYENKQGSNIRILLKSDAPEILAFDSAKALLPFSFDSSFL